jgi:hypothetical protein
MTREAMMAIGAISTRWLCLERDSINRRLIVSLETGSSDQKIATVSAERVSASPWGSKQGRRGRVADDLI